MDPADFRAGSQKFVTLMKAPDIAVGPILNGWLLDNQVSTFASYTSPSLLSQWDFVAVDSYQSGTPPRAGHQLPARAIPLLATWMDGQGFPDKPIGLGEYNGHTAEAVAAAGEAILSTPEVWFGLVWNSTERFSPLTGTRLTEFKEQQGRRPRPQGRLLTSDRSLLNTAPPPALRAGGAAISLSARSGRRRLDLGVTVCHPGGNHGAIGEPELPQDVLDVSLSSTDRDGQPLRDLRVREALSDEFGDLGLAPGQWRRLRRRRLGTGLQVLVERVADRLLLGER